jgi:hypothetical protein
MVNVVYAPIRDMCLYKKKKPFHGLLFLYLWNTYGYIMLFTVHIYVTKKDFPKKVKE